MVTDIKIYSEKDMKRMIKAEVSSRVYAYDLIINHLKNRLVDIEKIMEKK